MFELDIEAEIRKATEELQPLRERLQAFEAQYNIQRNELIVEMVKLQGWIERLQRLDQHEVGEVGNNN